MRALPHRGKWAKPNFIPEQQEVVVAITPKEKELVAVGISVAAGCKPCTDHHVAVVRKARATDEEIRQAANDALVVRRSAADIMQSHALYSLWSRRARPSFI